MTGRALVEGAWSGAALGLAVVLTPALAAGGSQDAWRFVVEAAPLAASVGAVAGGALALVGLLLVLGALIILRQAGQSVPVGQFCLLPAVVLAVASAVLSHRLLGADGSLPEPASALAVGVCAGALVLWRAPRVLRGRGLAGLRELSTRPDDRPRRHDRRR